jgi:hypothetical protein
VSTGVLIIGGYIYLPNNLKMETSGKYCVKIFGGIDTDEFFLFGFWEEDISESCHMSISGQFAFHSILIYGSKFNDEQLNRANIL